MTKTFPVFDGHNDLVLRILQGRVTAADVASGLPDGHIDKPRAVKGGFAGGFFAIFTPSPGDAPLPFAEMRKPAYDLPLPDMVTLDRGQDWAERGFAALDKLEAAGAIVLCKSVDDIATALHEPAMAAVAHIEGAEAIDPDLENLQAYHARGLLSLGPVWSRETIWGHGVPFRFPSSPDTGPGLTDAGKRLIRACNQLKIMVDLSHLNEKGFDDVAKVSDAPLVATHSNAWAVTPHARNLTDRQLDMIRDSDGMVGINFASSFLRPDGRMDDDCGFDVVIRHVDHLIEKLGEDRVGFGSDFDGAMTPKPLGDCAALPDLLAALSAAGVDDDLMRKLAYENWLNVLRRTWGG